MIETECFQELNIFYVNGQLTPDLRPEGTFNNHNDMSNSKPGFFSRLFKRKAGFNYALAFDVSYLL